MSQHIEQQPRNKASSEGAQASQQSAGQGEALFVPALKGIHERPDIFRPQTVLALQRIVGNQAVQRMLGRDITLPDPREAQQALGTPPVHDVSRVSATRTKLIQPRLMDIPTFKQEKDTAATRKLLNRTRSTGDYEKLHKKYTKALNSMRLTEALSALTEIDLKVAKMQNKTYWKGTVQRDNFLNRLRASVEEERLHVDKLLLKSNVKDTFEDSHSYHTPPTEPLVTDDMDYWRKKQRYLMVIEALQRVRAEVPAARDQIMDKQLIAQIDNALPMPTTYVDVYNEIANRIVQVAPQTRAQMLHAINVGALNAQQKAVEVARVLWGNFIWHTDGDNDFRNWAGGANNLARGTGATMNCWEAVLEVMVQAGLLTTMQVRNVYAHRGGNQNTYNTGLRTLLGWNGAAGHLAFTHDDYTTNLPPSGSVIFYESSRPPDILGNTLEHVVLSLGQNSEGKTEVMSLWNAATGGAMGKATMDQFQTQGTEYISFS